MTYPLFTAEKFKPLYFESQRFGWKIRAGSWTLENPTRGKVVILPGRGDFLEKYAHLASFLNDSDYSVYSLDWPGQGGSQRLGRHPQAGHIESYDHYSSVLHEFLGIYDLTHEATYWIAYSMGGLVAIQELIQSKAKVKKLVLLSPMFGFDENTSEVSARLLTKIAYYSGLRKQFALGEKSAEPESWQASESVMISEAQIFTEFKNFLLAHPQYVIRGSTWGWVRASLRAFRMLKRADLSGLTTPVLLIAARDEQTVSVTAQQEIARRLANASLMTLPGKHDLLLCRPSVVTRLFENIARFFSED